MDVDTARRADPVGRLTWARWATIGALLSAPATCLIPTGLSVLREPRPGVATLAGLGVVLVTVAQAAALYAAVTPVAERVRRAVLALFAVTAVGSIPLVGPLAGTEFAPWLWIGGSLTGTVPLLAGRSWSAATGVLVPLVAVVLARLGGADVPVTLLLLAATAVSVALMAGLPLWLWDLALTAVAGRQAQADLAAGQERLRFAQDLHDHLGHRLTVIALKAELVARISAVDPERAAREAGDLARLAQSALTETRTAVHGYQAAELPQRLAAVAAVLADSGVRCTVAPVPEGLGPAAATAFAAVALEASTNVLRHSRAGWCTIGIDRDDEGVRMTVTNDGLPGASAATVLASGTAGAGLGGLLDRMTAAGGTLRYHRDGDRFVLVARLLDPGPGG